MQCFGVVLSCLGAVLNAQSFANYETAQTRPVAVTADGSKLLALNTPDARLSVWSLTNPAAPVLLIEVQVGLEPVSLACADGDEVWVVNRLGDSISVVSLAAAQVVDTIAAADEPADVAFAGGRAFVSVSGSREVRVFDPKTRTLLGTVPIFGQDPRSLVVSPDGGTVWVVVHHSGNGTTLVPSSLAPPPPPPTNPSLPPAPQSGLIVAGDDPQWKPIINVTLPDFDVIEIDANSLMQRRTYTGVGTTLFAADLRPGTSELWVANTQARNLVQFEPMLRGHAIDSRLTRIDTGAPANVVPIDLNPGIDYTVLPNPSALATALSQPTGLAWDPQGVNLWVCAFGTDRVAVVDLTGAVVARIEIGNASGPQADPRNKRGPRAIAHHPKQPFAYVVNRISNSLTVLDTQARVAVREQSLGFDPTPPQWKQGRGFFYDAKLSGNGTMACASCHVDGDADYLAWDLGDPAGSMQLVWDPATGVHIMHPMKGPMLTQTMRGLQNTGPLHWRGDRAKLQSFNAAFDKLLGGTSLGTVDLDDLAAFGTTIAFHPNPNQNLDRSLSSVPAGISAADGYTFFTTAISVGGVLRCVDCHLLPSGTNGVIMPTSTIQGAQAVKVAPLRDVYRRTGFRSTPAGRVSGFGILHDGEFADVFDFLSHPLLGPLATQTNNKLMLQAFVESFDTGTAPSVGYAVTVTPQNATNGQVLSSVNALLTQALAGNSDCVALGTLDGQALDFWYAAPTGMCYADRSGVAPLQPATLLAAIGAGRGSLTFLGTTPGDGWRMALDRDLDGVFDGDEGLTAYGPETPSCEGSILLGGNSEPEIGNDLFALVVRNAPSWATGTALLNVRPAFLTLPGLVLLVEPVGAQLLPVYADGDGFAALAVPIPANPWLVGQSVYAQALFPSTCATFGVAASAGLRITIGQ